jgi:hypothetical protein
LKFFYIKIRNNLLPHPLIYTIVLIHFKKKDFRFSFWGKAMDFIGESGNRTPLFISAPIPYPLFVFGSITFLLVFLLNKVKFSDKGKFGLIPIVKGL